jgi:hypothetical protein
MVLVANLRKEMEFIFNFKELIKLAKRQFVREEVYKSRLCKWSLKTHGNVAVEKLIY